MPEEEKRENAPIASKSAPEQGKDFAVIVESFDKSSGEVLTLEAFQDRLIDLSRRIGCDYWAICHDRDLDADGNCKRVHYHIVMHMVRSRRIKSSVIKRVAECMHVHKDCVSVMFSYDLEKDIRYLCHLDDHDKTLYNLEDVITNDEESLQLAWKGSLTCLSFDEMISAIEVNQGSRVGVMRQIGMRAYKANWHCINDAINEYNLTRRLDAYAKK